jgi:NAD(P)-dependent dehydrogenase (short-subunit alcohol dehydrogenase family)
VSKAGLIHLTRCMAVAQAPETLVNCVAPGLLDGTRATANLRPEQVGRSASSSLLKKPADKDDCADIVVAGHFSSKAAIIFLAAAISSTEIDSTPWVILRNANPRKRSSVSIRIILSSSGDALMSLKTSIQIRSRLLPVISNSP